MRWPFFVINESGYPLRSSEGHSKKTFHHRDTEDTEKFKKQSGVLCALGDSSERSERVVKILALLTKQASGNTTQGFDSILRKRKACKKPVTIALTP
jgi:hypothetical protein